MKYKRILVIFGTRPEAIKMAPVVDELKKNSIFNIFVCITAQHREMLDQALNLFKITPDYDLDIMQANQTLADLSADILKKVTNVLDEVSPDLVLVHGDTTTAFASALACFYKKIPIGHVEAGLRTGNIMSPWPEEMNRSFISQIAKLHFAPTITGKLNLLAEGIPEKNIWIVGNTVVDSLKKALLKVSSKDFAIPNFLEPILLDKILKGRFIFVTGHRRENFGDGIISICKALKRIAQNNNIDILYPVHPNPNIMKPVFDLLENEKNIHLIPVLDYSSFIFLLNKSFFVITDSGGIQEEAPSLGKPVLLMRDSTERPESLSEGTIKIVGANEDLIVNEAEHLLNSEEYYKEMSKIHNPYGDGEASKRIIQIIKGDKNVKEFLKN